jgi:hypothetical protein
MNAATLSAAPALQGQTVMPQLDNLVEMLQTYENRLTALAATMDASWIERLFDAETQVTWRLDRTAAHHAERLVKVLKLHPVPPAAFASAANRLALLDTPSLIRVLAARALFARRAALRRCIDRAIIHPLRTLLGSSALHILQSAAGNCPLDAGGGLALPAASLSGTTWALNGYTCFKRDAVWSEHSLQALIQVALPATLPLDMPAIRSGADGESAFFLQLLPTMFPELTWLFG